MTSIFRSDPRIEVSLEQEVCWTYPSSSASAGKDSLVRGTVQLILEVRRTVRALHVHLDGLCDIHGSKTSPGWPKASFPTLALKVELFEAERELDAGVHVFEFSFSVPNSTAPMQRCSAGRVLHYVTASLNFTKYHLQAQISDRKRVYIAASRTPPGEVPETYDLIHENSSLHLGPIRVQLVSPTLTVGALLHLRIHLSATNENVAVSSINFGVKQQGTLHYRPSTTPPIVTLPLLWLDATQIDTSGTTPIELGAPSKIDARLMKGSSWGYESFLRLPLYPQLRCSFVDSAEKCIAFKHSFTLQVRYRLSEAEQSSPSSLRAFTMVIPVQIDTCMSLHDSLVLPAYSKENPGVIIRTGPTGTLCLCHYSVEELVEQFGAELKKAGVTGDEPSNTLTISKYTLD